MKTIGYAAQSADSHRSRHSPSSAARCARTTSRWRSSIAASATPTSTLRATTGAGRIYPLVPGHEIVGRVIAVGGEVTRFKAGDHVAVGCMVDSCQHCDQCRKGEEQLCREGRTLTYQAADRITQRHHLRRLFQARRGAAGVRAARARWARSRPRRAAAVRRHHHLFAAAHLERRSGQPGRRDRPRRARPHGGQARRRRWARTSPSSAAPSDKKADALALGADRLLVSTDEDAMAKAAVELRPHHRHRARQARHHALHAAARHRRHAGDRRAARPARRAVHRASASGAAPASPARPSAASPRPRRCSISAPRKNILPECEMIRMDQINEAFERHGARRRALPLRHRHGVAEGVTENERRALCPPPCRMCVELTSRCRCRPSPACTRRGRYRSDRPEPPCRP